MKKAFFILVFFVLCVNSICSAAQENCFDPLTRNLIFVEGQAEITVPVNYFALSFGFDIERASFSETSNESARIMNTIGANVKKQGLQDVEIIKGWDLLRQAKISLGSKGRRISNLITVRVKNFPADKLHELIARVIDESLAVDAAVALEGIEVSISEDVENKKKEEVTAEALKALQENAIRAAQALGKNAVIPKRIFVTNEQATIGEDYYSKHKYEYASAIAKSSLITIQKSFKIKAQVSDAVKLSARVSGVYQIE